MRVFSKADWRTLPLELLVVFVGLLAALQVDEWRDARQYREAETRYLQRLGEDLGMSISHSKDLLEFVEQNHAGVEHVNRSLQAGTILGGDTALFEHGLIYVGHLPSVSLHRSAYDEMVASGMFARLHSEELKRLLADLYATEALTDRNFAWWRNDVQDLSERLHADVTYYSEGPGRSSNPLLLEEPARRADFDFEMLAGDTYIRNKFYWAADTHSDWVTWMRRLLGLAEAAQTALDAALAARGR